MASLIDNKRASSAYQEVEDFLERHEGDGEGRDKFKTWALKFPSLIQSCGLMQSLSLCQEKSDDVYNIAAKWLKDMFFANQEEIGKITEKVSRLDMNLYRHAARELMAYMTWVKRATSVLMPDKPDEKETPSS